MNNPKWKSLRSSRMISSPQVLLFWVSLTNCKVNKIRKESGAFHMLKRIVTLLLIVLLLALTACGGDDDNNTSDTGGGPSPTLSEQAAGPQSDSIEDEIPEQSETSPEEETPDVDTSDEGASEQEKGVNLPKVEF